MRLVTKRKGWLLLGVLIVVLVVSNWPRRRSATYIPELAGIHHIEFLYFGFDIFRYTYFVRSGTITDERIEESEEKILRSLVEFETHFAVKEHLDSLVGHQLVGEESFDLRFSEYSKFEGYTKVAFTTRYEGANCLPTYEWGIPSKDTRSRRIYLYDRNADCLTVVRDFPAIEFGSVYPEIRGFFQSGNSFIFELEREEGPSQSYYFVVDESTVKPAPVPGSPVQVTNGLCYLTFDRSDYKYYAFSEDGEVIAELKSNEHVRPYSAYALSPKVFLMNGSYPAGFLEFGYPTSRLFLLDMERGVITEIGQIGMGAEVTRVVRDAEVL